MDWVFYVKLVNYIISEHYLSKKGKIIYSKLFITILLWAWVVNQEKIGFGGLDNPILIQKLWFMCQYAEVFLQLNYPNKTFSSRVMYIDELKRGYDWNVSYKTKEIYFK